LWLEEAEMHLDGRHPINCSHKARKSHYACHISHMPSHFSPAETFQAFELNAVANNMDDKDVLEKLLEVLNRIDGRLKSIESSVSTRNAAAPAQVEDVAALLPTPSDRTVLAESADLIEEGCELVREGPVVDVLVRHNAFIGASQKGKEIERPSQLNSLIELDAKKSINNDQNISSGSLISQIAPQLEQHEEFSSRVEASELSEEIEDTGAQGPPNKNIDGLNDYYLKMPAFFWEYLGVDRMGSPCCTLPETEVFWTELFGGLWSIPPDNRVDLTFQKHVLVSLPSHRAENITRCVGEWLKSFLGRQSRFIVIDIGDNNHCYPFYSPLDSVTSRENIERLTIGRIVFATPPPSDSHAKLEMSASRDERLSTWNRIM